MGSNTSISLGNNFYLLVTLLNRTGIEKKHQKMFFLHRSPIFATQKNAIKQNSIRACQTPKKDTGTIWI
jgi:hypothetical protein